VASKEKNKQKLTQLLLDLKAESDLKITGAINELSTFGDISIIPELIAILKNNTNHFRQKQVSKFLSDIHLPEASEIFMQQIRKEENTDILKLILPILWESKLDFSSYLADFVEISISGDYLIALDCLTIIENLIGPFSESQLLEAQLHLKEFIEKNDVVDQRKSQILSEIALFIKDQNEGIDADLLFD